ncbi:MAG: hypothetical protein KY468_20090, partial [Armatimonadetes bacterium]|nr:hypothetical protein [Armatimonadota bacterium]
MDTFTPSTALEELFRAAPDPAAATSLPRFRVVHLEMGRHYVGGPNQVLSLCRGLHDRGVDSWLVCPADSESGQKARARGLNVRTLNGGGVLEPRVCLQGRR